MLSPDPRRPPEQASESVDIAPQPPPVESVGGTEPNPGLTVVRGSSSSAQRRLGAAGPPALITMPRPGEVIATFLLEEAIGAGGMGAVFRALDTQLDRHVALKLLPPDQAADAEVVQRFYQEGRSAARLDHENIARVFSIGQDGSFHYIAFEYIEGVTLRQRVEASGPVKIAEAVDIALQIAHALVHACERGVVHRDIKPSNIILMPRGRAKLVDMGLARRFERGSDHGLTQSGMTLGTFDYISPEQARDPRDVDVRSDLYSLGCTLFHMLSGRPPFPGGTVLQKLIQHQEELPPDLRSLNPEVPADLAAVITRLMAKDRDRRYQSPEQLVRDLLGVAAALGLERTPAELEYWMARSPRPTWEHHLVWLLPAVGFVVVISGLVWWGREFSKPSTPVARPEAAALARLPQDLNLTGDSAVEAPRSPASGRLDPEAISAPPAYPRTIPVNSNEDLLAVLATAPRRSVIVLSDDGPYRLGGRNWSARAPKSLTNADLAIKPEPGVRPRIQFAGEPLFPDEAPSCLLQFTGGHVTIEGLEFELDAVEAEEPVAAIRIEGTELTLRGCSFRLNPSDGRPGRDLAALSIRGSLARSPGGERPPALVAESCHFDGGQAVVLAEGPAEVVLRDCTLGPAQPSIWFDNSRAASPIPCELRLLHSSILAGAGPVFRFDGSLVRAWVDDSVIATAGRAAATLLAVDDPRNLVWRGRSNVYSRIGVYLASAGKDGPAASVRDFASWAETPAEWRETGSRVAEGPVWAAADPLQALMLERENPTRVFLLSPSLAAAQRGARHGPFGSILLHARPVNRTVSEPVDRAAAARRGAAEVLAGEAPRGGETPVLPRPSPVPPDLAVAAATPPAPQPVDGVSSSPSQTDPMDLPSMPPMVPAASGSSTEMEATAGSEVSGLPPADPSARPEPAKTAPKRSPAAAPIPAVTGVAGEDLIRGSEQFLSRVKRLGRQGGSLWIAAGADLELPTVLLDGMARVQLRAEPGPRRPRLRFRAPLLPPGSPADWTVLFQVRAGTLELQGLDLLIAEQDLLRADRLAAVGLLAGAKLTMADCTVTLRSRHPSAAVFVAPPQREATRVPAPEAAATRGALIQLRNCFLRSGGDGLTVAGDRTLTLELDNVLAATEGSLVHALGRLRAASLEEPAVTIQLDQVTARVKGGLVHLESTPDEPELASVVIRAENSILSTAAGDHPLFRLEGQGQLDQLRDKVRWEGRKVAYHRIKTYRRDEVVQTGVSPRTYDRNDWTNAFLPKDESPLLGEIQFARESDPAQAPWTVQREDLRPAPGSPVAQVGADIDQVPRAPAEGEL